MTATSFPVVVQSLRKTGHGIEHTTLWFTGAMFAVALLLQRIGPLVGSVHLCIVGPIGLALAGYGVIQGILVLHTTRLAVFTALVSWIVLGTGVRAAIPDYYGTPTSWLSVAQFVGLSAFGVLVFAEPLGERRFFRLVNKMFLLLAIAGLAQFLLQFVGLGLFSWTAFVPADLLNNPFETVIPIGDSGYFKANGFFLVEPSVFSQYMALAVLIEMLLFRRPLHLATYAAALMSSISGTGWLMILGFALTAGFSLGGRGVRLSLATLVMGGLSIAGLAVLFPSGFDLFLSRTGEFSSVGASGHLRFVTPWWIGQFVLDRSPWVALYGMGAGVSEHLAMHPIWDFNLNPPVKISLEYGIPCFVLYLAFLLTGRRSMTQRALLAPVLILLLFDGGNSQFAPILFPSMILIMTADLSAGGAGRGTGDLRTLADPARS